MTVSNMLIKMELPRELLGVLDVSETDLGPKLKILIALELVREGRISTGKGAELLGVSKADFIRLLSEQDIPYFNETADELTEQITTISPLLDKLPL